MTISTILILKLKIRQILNWNSRSFFFFISYFFGLHKNPSIFPINSSCSQTFHRNNLIFRSSTEKRVYPKLQHKRYFQYISFSLIPKHKKIHFDFYQISIYRRYIQIEIRSWLWLHISNIFISMHTSFLFCSNNMRRVDVKKKLSFTVSYYLI